MFIGIDGGGTKTKGILIDERDTIIAHASAGPSALRSTPKEVWVTSLSQVIQSLLSQASSPIKAIFIGCGDVSSTDDQTLVRSALLERNPELKTIPLRIDNDVINAHASSFLGEEGMVLIAGTGSVVFGIDADRKTHRVGGYSFTEDDEGSAFHLGRLALKHLGKVFDKRAEPGLLSDQAFQHFKIESFADMVALYERHHTDRHAVARLAPWVTQAAAQGDVDAIGLIETATDSVLDMIKTVVKQLNFTHKRIAFIGSLAQSPTPYRDQLIRKIAHWDPSCVWLDAKHDPAYGAALIAKKIL